MHLHWSDDTKHVGQRSVDHRPAPRGWPQAEEAIGHMQTLVGLWVVFSDLRGIEERAPRKS